MTGGAIDAHAVADMDHLKRLTTDRPREFLLALNGGAYSRKTIKYTPSKGKFTIKNHIDDTRQILTEAELYTESNIGQWLDGGALYVNLA